MRRVTRSLAARSPRPPSRSSRTPQPEIRVERIAPGVAVLFGRGGNIGLSYGADGNILIDDQYAPATERVVAAVRDARSRSDPLRDQHPLARRSYRRERESRPRRHGDRRPRQCPRPDVDGAGGARRARWRRRPAGALPVITFSEEPDLPPQRRRHPRHPCRARPYRRRFAGLLDARQRAPHGRHLFQRHAALHRPRFGRLDRRRHRRGRDRARASPTTRRGSSPATARWRGGPTSSAIATC